MVFHFCRSSSSTSKRGWHCRNAAAHPRARRRPADRVDAWRHETRGDFAHEGARWLSCAFWWPTITTRCGAASARSSNRIDWKVCGEATNGREAVEEARQLKPG